MARAALLLNLVRTGIQGDLETFKRTVSAIADEERSKRHFTVADELGRLLDEYHPVTNVTPITKASVLKGGFAEQLPQLTLEDVVLADEALEVCEEIIAEHKQSALLQKHNMQPRHKVLLYGPPGNGKTSLAEAMAESLMVPFIKVNYDELISKYLGDTAKAVAQLFEQVKQKRCVLFFDEFEVLGKERGDEAEIGELKRVVSSLLIHIDSLPSNVVFIAATNHSEMLDRAVWRRFDAALEMTNPSETGMQLWIERFGRNVSYDFSSFYDVLLAACENASFAELEKLMLAIWRKFILSNKQADMASLVAGCIDKWKIH